MNGVWPAYPKRIADVLRKCNHRFPFLATNTQSTLVIRLSYVGDMLLIRYNYAFLRVFCVYEHYFINCHTQLYSVIPPLHTEGQSCVIVVGRLRNTRTDSIPEASSRPFINISIRMSGCTINLYRLTPFVHIILTAMCDRAPLSIYAGFPPIVCTL